MRDLEFVEYVPSFSAEASMMLLKCAFVYLSLFWVLFFLVALLLVLASEIWHKEVCALSAGYG